MSITTDSPAIDAPTEQPYRNDKPKLRLCLRCQGTFLSSWAGERICSHCKTTSAWRRGSPVQSHPHSNRRRD